ncbi:class I SAM-dependent methyltransferase [Candidatus Saccharibacteria bacterium]|nr:class I SAM-dependent methyltransferase [Candidatus Saccharibacteria bacterium]
MKYFDCFEKEMADLYRFPPITREEHGENYIRIALEGQKKGPVSEARIQKIFEAFKREQREKGFSDVEIVECFTKIIPRLRTNHGLAQFMEDYGVKSAYFIPWLLEVPSARCLEGAFGWGYDIAGNWKKIEPEDPFFRWTVQEPMFKYLRERAGRTADLVKGKNRVLVLGAGYLPEFRKACYEPRVDKQEVLAFDIDPNVNTHAIELELKKISNISISYRSLSIQSFFKMKDNYGHFDAIIMNGIQSYYLDKLEENIVNCFHLLNPNGVFVFDLQLMHWNLARDAIVFDFKTTPQMQLIESKERATEKVRNIIRRYIPTASLVVTPDSTNNPPTGVMFAVNKYALVD